MKVKFRYLRQVLCIVLCMTLTFMSLPLTAFSGETTVYVSSISGDDGNAGTQGAPVKTIERALELASDNDTIQIVDSASTQQLSTDEPLCITKAVTVTGGSLTLNRGGIVLGTDVTFRNISINLANPVRNAIVANGYTLTLENVESVGTYPVHLFAGEVTGYTGDGILPTKGSSGNIVISGTNNNLGNIYAGSLSEYGVENQWTGCSTITIAEGAGGTIGAVYAHGATEPRGTGDGLGMTPDSEKYTVSGQVLIELSGSNPSSVYGTTGGEVNADVIISGGSYQIDNLKLYDLASLAVTKGVVVLTALNENVDLTVASGAELVLSKVIDDEYVFSVGNFTGGGMLVMGQFDKLCITGDLTGTTEFQTDTTGRPADKSTSGIVEYSWPYIDVTNAKGTGEFTFESSSSQNVTWTLVENDEEGTAVWTTSEAPQIADVKPESFDIPITTYTLTHEDVSYGFEVPLDCVIDLEDAVWDVPFEITISKDGAEPVKADRIYDNGFSYSLYSLGFEQIMCNYVSDSPYGDMLFYTSASNLDAGDYIISISVVLSDETTVTKNITLTVTGGHIDDDDNNICDICLGYMDGVGASLAGYSLSLEGNIGVNFHMELDSSVLADTGAYMQFTLGGKEILAVKVSEAATKEIDNITYYVFKCGIPAKDMQTEITAQIVLGDGSKGNVYTYTVKDYADYILDEQNGYDDATVAMVEAMMNYGDYAKAYFAGETLTAIDKMNDVTLSVLEEHAAVVTGEGADKYYGSSLLLKSETIIRHYFIEEVEGSTKSGDMWYLDSTGIAAHLLGNSVGTTVGDVNVAYSPLSYAYAVLKNENASDGLKNLVKAMYLYNQAALAYYGI